MLLLRVVDRRPRAARYTSRRDGSAPLFEGVPPATPNLIKAYGMRATELAQQTSAQASLESLSWIFSAYRGIDATSLWAAATSRKAALPVHLLACLLARVWDGTKAVSLWFEIVAERRKEIMAKFDSGDTPYPHMWAAAFEHKQLLLIIKNVTLPVNEENVTYRSIITAWISALETMDRPIVGAPHVIRDGAILLALSSWHLYPNVVVVGGSSGTTEVKMSDPLVNPGAS
ncbi:hypothetical protein MMYC01_206494 [Madurella mycetomatis]|uniref:Uncharacterized protein n=1 Tax=Madurella mycetomatis TaxID=100816 RepID=A0A175W5T0_9PEZI|nr:hypothetical protein MMYC01_206494 [Madurella mycetomatis]